MLFGVGVYIIMLYLALPVRLFTISRLMTSGEEKKELVFSATIVYL